MEASLEAYEKGSKCATAYGNEHADDR